MTLALQAKAALTKRQRTRKGVRKISKYEAFQKKYWSDPVGFVRDCIKFEPDRGPYSYQNRILDAISKHKRTCVRSPHGAGKSATLAWTILWFALTRDGSSWKIPITASAWRQLSHYLMPEVHQWARLLNWERIGRPSFDKRLELQTLSLKLRTGEAFAMASDQPDLLEGAHAEHLLYIFDESKAVQDAIWDSAEGAFASGDALWLAFSTPGETSGRFYEIQKRKPGTEDWHVDHISMKDCLEAGSMSLDWVEARRRLWGETSAAFRNRVLGEFSTHSEDGVIPLTWVEAANERWLAWKEAGGVLAPFDCVGVDVGRGGDRTVKALRYGPIVPELRRSGSADTMEIVGELVGVLRAHGGYAVVDVIGIGAGVVDRAREQKYKVVAFNASERTDARDATGELGFINKRAAAWWNVREMLNPANNPTLALPPDDMLIGDLTAPKWKTVSKGLIQVESKDDLRKPERLGRSTDDGDAVVMCCWPERPADWEDVAGLGHVEGYVNKFM